ncbi:hypothetical protein GCM10010331_17720 [Streptomyces xanthochromogenes]|nr:hypothetical protein GCM10010331_17720 [Streptomyces xanthochromogenes]
MDEAGRIASTAPQEKHTDSLSATVHLFESYTFGGRSHAHATTEARSRDGSDGAPQAEQRALGRPDGRCRGDPPNPMASGRRPPPAACRSLTQRRRENCPRGALAPPSAIRDAEIADWGIYLKSHIV